MAFSGIKYLKTLILRPQIDIGSNILLLLGDAHVAACGLQSKGAEAPGKPALGLVFSGGRAGRPRAAMPGGPFDASQGFVDSLKGAKAPFFVAL